MTAPVGDPLEAYLLEVSTQYDLWAARQFHIRDKQNQLVTLHLNHVQRRLSDIEAEELAAKGEARIYVLKGRQGGISTDQQARALHLCQYTPGANALTLAHNREDTDKLFQITRRAVKEMYERMAELLPTLGRSEAKEISFPGVDSFFWTGTAGARRVGRGVTLTRFHGSEFAFWDDPLKVIASVTPAMIPRGSVMVLETTPDALESPAHLFWRDAMAGKNGFRAVFFPWWECDPPNYRLTLIEDDELGDLDDEERTLMEAFQLDLEQIKWRREKIKAMGKLEFMREYPEDSETCWITSGVKYYDAAQIWQLLRKAPEPVVQRRQQTIDVYASQYVAVQTDKGLATMVEDVIIGADVSEGVGLDRCTFTARAFPSWRLLAKFADSKIEPDKMGDLLYEWGLKIYGPGNEADPETMANRREALLVVEKNQHGITVLRKLRDLKYPMRSIYHRTPLGKTRDQKTEYIGWATTAESKPLMLDVGRQLLRAAYEGSIDVPSRDALRDAWSVTDGELNGRDVLVSEILCWVGREYLVRRRTSPLSPLYW